MASLGAHTDRLVRTSNLKAQSTTQPTAATSSKGTGDLLRSLASTAITKAAAAARTTNGVQLHTTAKPKPSGSVTPTASTTSSKHKKRSNAS